jgi:hypothetical protein
LALSNIFFFQIKALVVKNAFWGKFIGGHYTQKECCAILSSKCGATLEVFYILVAHDGFEFELKLAYMFFC